MKQGFDFLKCRSITEKIDLNEIEEELNFTLPPIFKLFVENFHYSSDAIILESHFDKLREITVPSEAIIFSPSKEWGNPIYFDCFLDIMDLIEKVKEAQDTSDWIDMNLLVIGYTTVDSRICIRCNEKNIDEIWEVNDDSVNKYKFLAKNIFEFIRGFNSTKDH